MLGTSRWNSGTRLDPAIFLAGPRTSLATGSGVHRKWVNKNEGKTVYHTEVHSGAPDQICSRWNTHVGNPSISYISCCISWSLMSGEKDGAVYVLTGQTFISSFWVSCHNKLNFLQDYIVEYTQVLPCLQCICFQHVSVTLISILLFPCSKRWKMHGPTCPTHCVKSVWKCFFRWQDNI